MSTDQAKAAVVVECVMVPRELLTRVSNAMADAADSDFMGDWYHETIQLLREALAAAIPNPYECTSGSPTTPGVNHRRYGEPCFASSPDSSRLGEGLTDAEREALSRWEARLGPTDDDVRIWNDARAVCAALKRLSASPGVAGDVSDAMVERAARAMCTESHLTPDTIVVDFDNKPAPYWKSWEKPARAALTAALGTVQRG